MILLEGALSVKAALLNGQREVYTLYIDEKKKCNDTKFILRTAKEKNVMVKRYSREKIDAMAKGKTHGGVVAEVSLRKYQTLEETLSDDAQCYVLIEGIEDPFNLGYIARTLVATGMDGLISVNRDFSTSESTIIKSSAGASEKVAWINTSDVLKDIQTLKQRGYQVVCAYRNQAISMYDYDFTQKTLLCIGGEMRGLSKEVLNQSDQNIVIPYATDFKNALNASSAATALCFEAMRQKAFK